MLSVLSSLQTVKVYFIYSAHTLTPQPWWSDTQHHWSHSICCEGTSSLDTFVPPMDYSVLAYWLQASYQRAPRREVLSRASSQGAACAASTSGCPHRGERSSFFFLAGNTAAGQGRSQQRAPSDRPELHPAPAGQTDGQLQVSFSDEEHDHTLPTWEHRTGDQGSTTALLLLPHCTHHRHHHSPTHPAPFSHCHNQAHTSAHEPVRIL